MGIVLDKERFLASDLNKVVIITEEAPLPLGPYSQAIKVGDLVFTSGQIAIDQNQELIKGGIDRQTEVILNNLEAILKAADSSLKGVAKLTVFLKNINDFTAVNLVFEEYFKQEPPAREAVAVSGLPKDADLEISAIALANQE